MFTHTFLGLDLCAIILDSFLTFQVLPVIIFFSTMISVFYYLGIMQVVIRGVAVVMQFCMGTTAAESLSAAGNIFIGMVCLLYGVLSHDM